MHKEIYEIMHKDKVAAQINAQGHSTIFEPSFLPYDLYLEEEEDIDTLVNNVINFHCWCAARVLTLDRAYAKEILNSIGMKQAVTDKQISFQEINLYENHLDRTFIDIALKGKQYTVQNEYLSRDLSTNGCFPKAWKREGRNFLLLKDGGNFAVERELLASKICRCFDVSQVFYEEGYFDGEKVSVSQNITSIDYAIASMEAVEYETIYSSA